MAVQGITTTHELADYLDSIAKGLRLLPDVPLQGLGLEDATQATVRKSPRATKVPVGELKALASQIRELTKEEAEARLFSMPVAAIQEFAPLVGIRIPSKAKKEELVETLLLHLFDLPKGAEVIRGLHANR